MNPTQIQTIIDTYSHCGVLFFEVDKILDSHHGLMATPVETFKKIATNINSLYEQNRCGKLAVSLMLATHNARNILDNHQEHEKKELLIISVLSVVITGYILDQVKLPFLTYKQTRNFCFACHKKFQHKCKSCSGCEAVRYCSKECQKKDWAVHRNECKILHSHK